MTNEKPQNKQIMDPENPLVAYKTLSKKTWPEISNMTGVSVPRLIVIATLKPNIEIEMKLNTYLKIRETLGIRMELPASKQKIV